MNQNVEETVLLLQAWHEAFGLFLEEGQANGKWMVQRWLKYHIPEI